MMQQKHKKRIAVFLLLTFLSDLVLPTMVFGLTGGPSQPEVQSFEPVGTNQMVDLSTGDFNYNLPLMTVPGPNGGYPINLAYHAGIGMEQEASWTGLGWNINPGAIVRNLRGIPDDFKGDIIVKRQNIKKDVTVGIGVNTAIFSPTTSLPVPGLPPLPGSGPYEMFGQYVPNPGLTTPPLFNYFQVYYNNYRGVGYSLGTRGLTFLNKIGNTSDKPGEGGITGSLNFSFDSQKGLGMNIGFGIGKEMRDESRKWNIGTNVHSRQGLQSLTFNRARFKEGKFKSGGSFKNFGGGISFVNHTYVPALTNSMKGVSINSGITLAKKTGLPYFRKKYKVDLSVITNGLKNKERDLLAYGMLYLQNRGYDHAGTAYNSLTDLNVSNDVPITKRAVNMGFPFMTGDLYSVTGQGIGGVYRAHRTDVGRLYKTGNTSEISIGPGSIEAGMGPSLLAPNVFHAGYDGSVSLGYHKSYSGKWTGGVSNISGQKFKDTTTNNPLYEPVYFKMSGEQSVSTPGEWSYMKGEQAVAYDLMMEQEEYTLKPQVASSSGLSSKSETGKRVKRSQNIGHRNSEQIQKDEFYDSRPYHIFTPGVFPSEAQGTADRKQINYENGEDHHIQEYSILRPDGTTYTYGLPAYNNIQREKIFAHTSSNVPLYQNEINVEYDPDDADVENDEGFDNYFSSTEIPAYVHSNLITSIHSADYVDLTNNGPSEDDFGFYAKFNYVKVEDYQWREPYANANYIKGYYSNALDDKASYVYGKKDLYYTHSIETKTHIALFELGDRSDARGVFEEDQTDASGFGAATKYLKKIRLYSKKNLIQPLQTVHFEYSYELCPNVPNFDMSEPVDSEHILSSNDKGKLTLKKVYITYNGNEKGRLSPYEFTYGNNYTYSKLNIDRWGNYQTSTTPYENAENPYTHQDLDAYTSNAHASAWCLNRISLPSGAEIEIDYEADDYGYVQDQRAMQMFEIYGFSKISSGDILPASNDATRFKVNRNYRRLWFKLPTDLVGSDSDKENTVRDYVHGIKEVYFKAFMQLKNNFPLSVMAHDYVTGYAKLETDSFGYDLNSNEYAYVDLQKVEYQNPLSVLKNTHPFRKAAWQYIRYQRPDLSQNQNAANDVANNVDNNSLAVYASFVTFIDDALSFFGYYNMAALRGFGRKMTSTSYVPDRPPSYIRLNSPKKKIGGGHRVAAIRMHDNWVEGARVFGQTYTYENEDGSTSGVADYEPLIGGEENALKKPIWYNGNDQLISFHHIDAFVEQPLAEAVYPGARVIYGRVVQKNLEEENFSQGQTGITVQEYYTAKDFPVIEKQTALKRKGFNLSLTIPFVGNATVQNNGYSQGYTVTLNDMSGRPKSIATYPYRTGSVSGLPVTKTEYIYRTNGKGRLNNKVEVINGAGVRKLAYLGVEQDFVVNEEENHTISLEDNLDANIDAQATPIIVIMPSLNISIDFLENYYRGLSTGKVIYKTGILDEVKVYNEGSYVSTKNLLYDEATGDVVLTKTINEWDKPVYQFSSPAHWYYEGMQAASDNYGAVLKIEGLQNALELLDENDDPLELDNILMLGDEISIYDVANEKYNTYYVSDLDFDDDKFGLQTAGGSDWDFPTAVEGRISRSGKRNLQSVRSGVITALNTNFLQTVAPGPILQELSYFVGLWNNLVAGGYTSPAEANLNHFNGDYSALDPYYQPHELSTTYFLPDYSPCSGTISNQIAVLKGVPGNLHQFNISILGDPNACHGTITFNNGSASNDSPVEKGYISTSSVMTGGSTHNYNTADLHNFQMQNIYQSPHGGGIVVEFEYLPTGEIFNAFWQAEFTTCFIPCIADGILHAEATTYADDWKDFIPYADLGNPTNGTMPISTPTLNDYRYGKKGIWRQDETLVYQVKREQNGDVSTDFKSKIDVDGEYELWHPFNWANPAANTDWDWISRATKYSPYGYALEEEGRLSYSNSGAEQTVFSSQLYGYENSLVTAVASNAKYNEIAFNSFEEDNSYVERGHIVLIPQVGLVTHTLKSHTGKRSLQVQPGQSITLEMNPMGSSAQLKGEDGKEYIVSLWINAENSDDIGTLTINNVNVTPQTTGEIIDGWKKLEAKFTMGTSIVPITYTSTQLTYVDDIRVGPYDGGMTTYVYDPNTLWLTAELDGLNYATFYNYDNEGKLVQVKKETEKGVVTLQTSRSNIKQIMP